jgi:hypothetical protein
MYIYIQLHPISRHNGATIVQIWDLSWNSIVRFSLNNLFVYRGSVLNLEQQIQFLHAGTAVYTHPVKTAHDLGVQILTP